MIYNFSFVPHSVLLMPHTTCSPVEEDLPTSSSRSLSPSDVDSIPTASTPRDAEDAEVGSKEGTRQEGEAPEVPQGNLPDFVSDSAPEPTVVPESGERPLHKKGKTVTPAASFQPEAPDNLLEALNGASIKEEHRTIMSVVIQKVQLAKSGLTEAWNSLLTGFEARNLKYAM